MLSDSSIIIPFHQVQTSFQKFKSLPNLLVVIMLAPIVGVCAGFGAIVMEWLVYFVYKISFEDKLWGLLDGVGPFHLVIIPTLGFFIVGVIILRFARETKGRSVPEVLKSVAICEENIPPKSLAIKSLTSALCVGTGGSAGLGGPTGQLGSAFGVAIGHLLMLSKDNTRLLFSCGIGAGIAAAFHAPIMGSIFALEVVLGRFNANNFIVIFISAVVADAVAQLYQGHSIILQQYTLVSSWELLLYAVLGVIIAISAMGFTRALSGMKTLWDKLPVSEYMKPMLGGLMLGGVALLTFKTN
jgi:CIC family chloride channel protein